MKYFLPIDQQKDTLQALFVKRRIKTRIIYTIVISAVICFLLSLPFIYIDVSIQNRGFVNSAQRNNIIQSAINAKIELISIKENMHVNAFDTLIILNTDEIDVQIDRLQKKIAENSLYIMDLTSLIKGTNKVESSKYTFKRYQFESRDKEVNEQTQHLQSEYNVSKVLYKQGVETKLDFENKKSNLNI